MATPFADLISGTNDADIIDGLAGNDTIDGGGSNDLIYGGDGDDVLTGGAGFDTVQGGNGSDEIRSDGDGGRYFGEADNDVMGSVIGAETMDGGVGVDTIDHRVFNGNYTFNITTGLTSIGGELFSNFENAYMGNGNDSVIGTSSANSIDGGGGNDRLTGCFGIDTLTGVAGADRFVYTTLTEGIIGSPAAPTPTFEKIIGFTVGSDRFDVSTVPPIGGFNNLGAVATLTSAGIGSLLSAANFVANGAATFTSGSGAGTRIFIAFNNANAGYSSTTDLVVEITGYSFAAGFSSLSQISIA